MFCQHRLSWSLRWVVTGASLCVVLVSLGMLLAGCQGGSSPTVAAANATPTKGRGSLLGDGDPQIYWDTIKQEVAQGLHRSVADLTALWGASSGGGQKGGNPPAAVTISDVATQEGLTRDQLTTLELNAIQTACTQLVNQGALTQAQADARMQEIRGWSLSDLDGYTMYAFNAH